MGDLRYWIGFNLVPRLGPVRLATLIDTFGDVETAWHAPVSSLRAAGLPRDALQHLLDCRTRLDLEAELRKVDENRVQVLTWESPDYPTLLRNIYSPPPVLYVRGALSDADGWAVAVVGTRSPSSYGKEVARRLSGGLAEAGVTVVSGLALGIDGIAHRASLDAGGRTLAVLGHGLDSIYPARHRELAHAICEHGALLSDYSLGTRPDAGNFPPRNRLISGLALGTLVVEAGERSGALITLRFALEQDRESFAVPGSVFSRTSEGTNAAIRRGEAKLVSNVQDVLEELNLTLAVQQSEVREAVPESPTEKTLLSCLDAEPTHIDEIVRESGLATATVSSALCMMELKGIVRRVDNMSYVLSH